MIHRFLLFTWCFTSLFFGTLKSSGQPVASTPNNGSSISHNAGTVNFHLQWWAQSGHHYFIEVSDDLQGQWQLVPLTMKGADSPATYGFSSSSDKLFLRLVYAEDPDSAFRIRYPAPDAGQLPDWWQIFYFQSLNIAPQGDASGNTFSNLWHYENAEHPFDYFLDDEPTIQIDSGDGQTGDAGAILPQTLRVLIEVDGQPAINAPVVFAVPAGLGLVRDPANGGAWGKQVTVRTDSAGHAEVQFRLPFALDYTAAVDAVPDVYKSTPPEVFFEAFTADGININRLTAGASHSAALDGDGKVWTWGRNNLGQLGDGSTVDKWFPQAVAELDSTLQISAGYDSTYALLADGTIQAWGSNGSGRLGNDSTTNSQTPVAVHNLASIRQVAGGRNHVLALDEFGEVWTWGAGGSGQLGHADSTTRHIAQKISGFTNVVQVAAGDDFSGAVKENGTLWMWGNSGYGQLGFSGNANTPVEVLAISDVDRIALGGDHTLALCGNGTVWAWGRNSYGQLGNGNNSSTASPVQVAGLVDIVWIEVGRYHSLALDKDGVLYAWGRNTDGRLGNGTIVDSNVPVEVGEFVWTEEIAGFAAGSEHSIGITADGNLWGWGSNSDGQLGNGNNEDFADPSQAVLLTLAEKVQQPGLTIPSGAYVSDFEVTTSVATPGAEMRYTQDGSTPEENDPLWPTSGDLEIDDSTFLRVRAFANDMLPGETKTATYRLGPSVTAGSSHSAALDGDGEVWTWGSNSSGQLGDGSTVDKWFPQVLTGLDPVTQISAGYDSTYALLADGTIQAWGSNGSGRLGNDSTTNSQTPVAVHNLTSVRQIAGGGDHALALDDFGEVWTWGAGGSGQLGHADSTTRHIAQKISGFTNVVQVAAGDDFSGAVKEDGSLWMWGNSGYGQLGFGGNTNQPAQVGRIFDVVHIALGKYHTLALRGDGTVWAWGRNNYGQLGNGNNSSTSVPMKVGGLVDIVWIEAGQDHSLALDKNGVLYAWGHNIDGRLGDGTEADSNVPVEVGESVWTGQITGFAAGGEHSIGITADGTLWGWGQNNHGQLGNSSTVDSTDPSQISALTFAPKAGIPQLSQPSGTYPAAFTVDATAPTIGSVLRYTLDGSEPDTNSTLWPAGADLEITQSSVLKVRAFGPGLLPGEPKTATFRIGPSVTAGTSHSVALDGEGRVWTWGRNDLGQLGDGSTLNKWSPQVVPILDPVIQISAGSRSTYALLADGTVEAWGSNNSGRLGNDSTSNSPTPVAVHNLASVRQVASGDAHALALDENGEVWSWGSGSSGQLGHGNNDTEWSPVKITMTGFDSVAQVAAGDDFSGAVKNDGTVWMWGQNRVTSSFSGKLGNTGGGISQSLPTQVGGISDVIRISLGKNHTLALRGDGTVWAWGRNFYGQLGNSSLAIGNYGGSATPVQVTGLSDIVWIEAGKHHSLALDEDGVLYAWGDNAEFRLGDGTDADSNVPIPITPPIWDGHSIYGMAAGGEHSIGITDYMGAPIFFAWGRNYDGQLGLGDDSAATATTPALISIPIDSDQDGLSDYEELLLGFNPANPDTTGTGFGDYLIFSLGYDPSDTDWNDNGISNQDEIAQGTNPFPGPSLPGGAPTFPLYPTLSDLGTPDPGDTTPPDILLIKPPEADLQ